MSAGQAPPPSTLFLRFGIEYDTPKKKTRRDNRQRVVQTAARGLGGDDKARDSIRQPFRGLSDFRGRVLATQQLPRGETDLSLSIPRKKLSFGRNFSTNSVVSPEQRTSCTRCYITRTEPTATSHTADHLCIVNFVVRPGKITDMARSPPSRILHSSPSTPTLTPFPLLFP